MKKEQDRTLAELYKLKGIIYKAFSVEKEDKKVLFAVNKDYAQELGKAIKEILMEYGYEKAK